MASNNVADLGFKEADTNSHADLGFNEVPQDKSLLQKAGETAYDTALGATQGATFGLADELEGGLKTGGQVLTGSVPTKLEDIVNAYRQNRDKAREAYKAAEERSPTASTVGNIAGAIIPSVLTAGAAAPEAGAGLAARLGTAIKVGTGAGALGGLGNSEADLTKGQVGQAAIDTTIGGATGAVGGGILGGVAEAGKSALSNGGKLASKIVSYIKDEPYIANLIDTFKTEKSGVSLTGNSGFDAALDNLHKVTNELATGVKNTAESFPGAIDKVIKRADEAGFTADTSEVLDPIKKKLQYEFAKSSDEGIRKDIATALNKIENYKFGLPEGEVRTGTPEKSASELVGLRRQAQELSHLGDSNELKTQYGKRIGGDLVGALKEQEQNIPGLSEVNERASASMKALDALGLEQGKDFTTDADGNVILKALDASKIANKIQQMGSSSTNARGAREFIQQVLTPLKVANPNLAEQIAPKIEQAAQQVDLAKGLRNEGLGQNLVGSTKSLGLKSAAGLGKVAKSITDSTPDELKSIASSLVQQGGNGYKAAQSIVEALKKDDTGRNAALFTLQQNPAYREMLQKYFPDQNK